MNNNKNKLKVVKHDGKRIEETEVNLKMELIFIFVNVQLILQSLTLLLCLLLFFRVPFFFFRNQSVLCVTSWRFVFVSYSLLLFSIR